MNDKEFLTWVLERLACVHGENRNTDYMLRFSKIIEGMCEANEREDAEIDRLNTLTLNFKTL
tara:strand:+ start:401 stop:586 length:186 start_codon:yes stop_codon:yes gene_type:complete